MLPGEALVLPVDFFFDEVDLDVFLAVFLEDFVVMIITPLLS